MWIVILLSAGIGALATHAIHKLDNKSTGDDLGGILMLAGLALLGLIAGAS